MPSQVIAAKPTALGSGQEKVRGREIAPRILFLSLLGDTFVIGLSLAFSSWLRFELLSAYGSQATTITWTDYFSYVGFGTLLFVILLPHREIYDLHRILKFRQIVAPFLKAALTWLVVFMALAWLLRTNPNREISRIYVMVAFAVTTTAFLSWRFVLYKLVSADAIAPRLRQRILFVGWSNAARSLAQAILADNRHPYEIVGYVPAADGAPGGHSVFVRKLGEYSRIADVTKEYDIDMVIQADMAAPNPDMLALADLCEREMIDFKVLPGCFQVLQSCLRLETVSGVPVLGVSDLPLDKPFNLLVKQSVDWFGGLVGLVLSSPLVVLFGLIVYCESPGPIIYRQKRLGIRGRPFWIYKIRSMKMNAEVAGKVGWTVKDDPRRLRVGAFMRKWNIDELPQFFNVLQGHMSLVGPRPERPELIDIFKDQIAHYNARHNIKPGITGWAQVNGLRGDTDLSERVRYDLYYIENWNAALDLQIMAMTLFRQKNAG